MPSFSLPKFSLPQRRYLIPIILFLIFVFLIFAVEGYYYFKIARQKSELQRIMEEKAEVGREKYGKVVQEIETQQEEISEKRSFLIEECLLVPPVDPMIGIFRIDKINESIADYFYEGKIVGVEEIDYQGCDYIKLTLEIRNEFEIAIPSALLAETDLGETSAMIYQEHIGERVQIKIRYEKDLSDPEILKILEWQPLVFVVE